MSDNDNNKDLELDHEYDGIKEYDHPLPKWWLLTFYGAIIFGVIYFSYYVIGSGPTLRDEFSKKLEAHQTIQDTYLEKMREFDVDKFVSAYNDESVVLYGESLFTANCVGCHAQGGKGDIGPNLTDDYWLFSLGTPETIYPFILSGSQGGGMPSWSDKMEKEEIYAVLAYVLHQQGKEYEGEKEPQGNQFPAWYPGMKPQY